MISSWICWHLCRSLSLYGLAKHAINHELWQLLLLEQKRCPSRMITIIWQYELKDSKKTEWNAQCLCVDLEMILFWGNYREETSIDWFPMCGVIFSKSIATNTVWVSLKIPVSCTSPQAYNNCLLHILLMCVFSVCQVSAPVSSLCVSVPPEHLVIHFQTGNSLRTLCI